MQNLATTYYWIHNSVGVVTTGLTTLVAVNTQGKFLWQWAATTVAILATCCTFLLTAFNAKAKAERFELAGREVEKAITLYEYDDSLSLKDLRWRQFERNRKGAANLWQSVSAQKVRGR